MKPSIYGLGCLLSMLLLVPGFAGTVSLAYESMEVDRGIADLLESEAIPEMDSASDFLVGIVEEPEDLVEADFGGAGASVGSTTVITLTILPAPAGSPLAGLSSEELEALRIAALGEESEDEREEVIIEDEIVVPAQLLVE